MPFFSCDLKTGTFAAIHCDISDYTIVQTNLGTRGRIEFATFIV